MSGASDAMYHALIVEHDRAPRNEGPLEGATNSATLDNPLCGDIVTMRAIVTDGCVIEVKFEARGCALCRAAASMLTARIEGVSVDEVGGLIDAFEGFLAGGDAELGDLEVFAAARQVRSRRSCMLLPFRAIAKALVER